MILAQDTGLRQSSQNAMNTLTYWSASGINRYARDNFYMQQQGNRSILSLLRRPEGRVRGRAAHRAFQLTPKYKQRSDEWKATASASARLPMVNHCANPHCCKPLHYLREGRVYVFDVSNPPNGSDRGTRRMEHFWLCGACSETFFLEQVEDRSVRIASRAQRSMPPHSMPYRQPIAS